MVAPREADVLVAFDERWSEVLVGSDDHDGFVDGEVSQCIALGGKEVVNA
jgi:hypothetical protein